MCEGEGRECVCLRERNREGERERACLSGRDFLLKFSTKNYGKISFPLNSERQDACMCVRVCV